MAAGASAVELEQAIKKAKRILACAVDFGFTPADVGALEEAITIAEADLVAVDEDAQATERGQKIDALNAEIDRVLVQDHNRGQVEMVANELRELVAAIPALVQTSQDTLAAAGAAPARLEVISAQRAELRLKQNEITARLERLADLPSFVSGVAVGITLETRDAAILVRDGTLEGERNRLAGIATGFVTDLENATQAAEESIRNLSIALQKAREEGEPGVSIASIIAQRDILNQQKEIIQAAADRVVYVTNEHAEGIDAQRQAALATAGETDRKLAAALQIIELSLVTAEAQQVQATAKAAIEREVDPARIPDVVKAQLEDLDEQAKQIATARGEVDRIPADIRAGLSARLAESAIHAADVEQRLIVDARGLAEQQILAAKRIIALRDNFAGAAQDAVTAAERAIGAAVNPRALADAVREHQANLNLQSRQIDDAIRDLNLPAGLNPNLRSAAITAAQNAKAAVVGMQRKLVAAEGAAQAVVDLGIEEIEAGRFVIRKAYELSEAADRALGDPDAKDKDKLEFVRDHLPLLIAEQERIAKHKEKYIQAPVLNDARRIIDEAEDKLEQKITALEEERERAADALITTVEDETRDATQRMRELLEELTAARDNPDDVARIQAEVQEKKDRLYDANGVIRMITNDDAPEIEDRRNAAIADEFVAERKLDSVIAILPHSYAAAVARQAVAEAIDAIDEALEPAARRDAVEGHCAALANQLQPLNDALDVLEAKAPMIAIFATSTVEKLIIQEITAVKEAKAAVIAAQTRAEHEKLAAELSVCITKVTETIEAGKEALREALGYGERPEKMIEIIDAQLLSLAVQKQRLADAVRAAKDIPNGVANIVNLRVEARRADEALKEQERVLEEGKTKAEKDLENIKILDAAIEEGKKGIAETRVRVNLELSNPDKTPVQRIVVIDEQQKQLTKQIKEIEAALSSVKDVAGIELLKGAANDQIGNLKGECDALEANPKKEQQNLAVKSFKDAVANIEDRIYSSIDQNADQVRRTIDSTNRKLARAIEDGDGNAIQQLQTKIKDLENSPRLLLNQLMKLNSLLVAAILDGRPEKEIEDIRKDITKLEERFNVAREATDIKVSAEALDRKIRVAGAVIGGQLTAERAYLKSLPKEIAAKNKFNTIMQKMDFYQWQTANLRDLINFNKRHVKFLTDKANSAEGLTDLQKKQLAVLARRLQSAIDQLHNCEQVLEQLEAERVPAMADVEAVLVSRRNSLWDAKEEASAGTEKDGYHNKAERVSRTLGEYNKRNNEIWDHSVNVPVYPLDAGSGTTSRRVDGNIAKLKEENKKYSSDSLIYANAQKAVEPPVVLPADVPAADKSSNPIDGAFKNQRAKANLKDAKVAIEVFKKNEKKVQPLIQAVQQARLDGDEDKEAAALVELNMFRKKVGVPGHDDRSFNHLEHRKKLYDNAKAAIETLNKRMADLGDLASDDSFKIQVIAVKHEWSMADKEMRAKDMNHEIDLHAKKLKENLYEIAKQLDELKNLKEAAPPPDGIDTQISAAEANLNQLSADAQHNAQRLVDLQSARRNLQEAIRLETEKVEEDLTELLPPSAYSFEIDDAREQTKAAEGALAGILTPDDEVANLVSKWNGLRLAYGQNELPTAADQLSREGKTLAERRIWAQVELFNLLDFAIEDIVRDPKLFARYTEAMAILRPSLKLEQTKEHVKEQIGKTLENDTELATLMKAGGETQLKHWRADEPREFKTKESKKYIAWKEELQKWQIEKIANSRFASDTTIPFTVVGIENSNNHTVSFFVAQADFYGVTANEAEEGPGVVRIEADATSGNTKYFSSPEDTEGTVLPIRYPYHLNAEKKAEILRAIPRKYTSMKPLLTYVEAQAALLADPAQRDNAKDNIVKALQSAKADPRYAMSRVASSVAEKVASGLQAAGIDHADSIYIELQKEIVDARQKDPRVAMEDSSVTADIPFEAVRRRMIAQMILDNPTASTPQETAAAKRVIAVYDKGGDFTARDDLDAAQLLENRGFKSGDAIKIPNADGSGQDVYKVTATDDSINLTLKKMDGRGHTSTEATIEFQRLGTEQTIAKISAKPSAGPAAAALAAKKITAPLPPGNKTITFQLKDYDHGLFDVGGKKGAKREAEYIAAILDEDIVPVFKQHETRHHDSAIWATFKDLAIAANKQYTDGVTCGKYLEAVLKSPTLEKELISGMFTKTGTLGPDKKMRICDDNKKSYTQAEFEQLAKDDQKRIIIAQSIKPQDVLDKDKEFLKKITTVQSENSNMGMRPTNGSGVGS